MSKIKVYELAKELDVPSKELIEFLGGKNIEVKNHMSSLEDADADMVKSALTKAGRGGKCSERQRNPRGETPKKKNIVHVFRPQNTQNGARREDGRKDGTPAAQPSDTAQGRPMQVNNGRPAKQQARPGQRASPRSRKRAGACAQRENRRRHLRKSLAKKQPKTAAPEAAQRSRPRSRQEDSGRITAPSRRQAAATEQPQAKTAVNASERNFSGRSATDRHAGAARTQRGRREQEERPESPAKAARAEAARTHRRNFGEGGQSKAVERPEPYRRTWTTGGTTKEDNQGSHSGSGDAGSEAAAKQGKGQRRS